MKVFDMKNGTDYIVNTDKDGNFVCPKCNRVTLKLKELPYGTLNDGKTSPQAQCSCGAHYWYPQKQQ